ncbi:hypothetical protein KH5_00330 [Urechidicola sp. KH5]
MFRKQFLMLIALVMVGAVAFGQKNELKTAEKALKKKDFGAALTALQQAESLIANADAKSQAKYYYLKGTALYANGTKPGNVNEVAKAFNKLLSIESKSGSSTYTKAAAEVLTKLINEADSKAQKNYQEATASNNDPVKLKKAAESYKQVYLLSPADTSYYYNTALIYQMAKEYEKSNKVFMELLDLGYTGVATQYIATSKVSGELKAYASKSAMNKEVKLGLAENPEVKVSENKRITIIKSIGLNYAGLDNNEKALEFLQEARKANPDDFNLIIQEANTYFRMGNKEKFKSLLEEAIKLDPNNAQLHYNIGIMNNELGDDAAAIASLKRSAELEPEKGESYNAIANIILKKVKAVSDEMDANAANFKKYDQIKVEKYLPILREALPYLEKSYELSPDDTVKNQLNALYENLEMDKKVE